MNESHVSSQGLSPHTRGARPHESAWIDTGGDHPRIRGEHNIAAEVYYTVEGSSPHTRGALLVGVADSELLGIIPAYAGSTIKSRQIPFTDRDHPRIRGEHGATAINSISQPGSSPHTRGAPASVEPSS